MKCPDELVNLPVSEWAELPLLVEIGWTKIVLINLIQSGIIKGSKDPKLRIYVTNEKNIKKGLAYRDNTIKEDLTSDRDLGFP